MHNVYDNVTKFEVCEFMRNTKSNHLENNIYFSSNKKFHCALRTVL